LALAAAPAAGESRRTKRHLAHEETSVQEETVAARLVAAKQATSFDSEMAHLNAELFPNEKKAVWHHKSPTTVLKRWSDVSKATMGTGGDELMHKAEFAASPKVVPAAGSAAVLANKAVSKKEALSAAEQAAAEIEHIKAVTEASFPTMKKAVEKKQTASQMVAQADSETNNVFPKRFAKEEAKGNHLMAKKLARVQEAQKELFGKVQARLKVKGMMQQANRVAMAQHRIAQEEKRARLEMQKQKQKHMVMQRQGAASTAGGKKPVLPNNWMTRKMQGEQRKQHKEGPAAGKQTGNLPASGGRKPISSDFAVNSEGTNVAFLGASQAGDKWFHGHSSAKKSQASSDADDKIH
jgi:hypothetical protein